jgi:hypothetical protein
MKFIAVVVLLFSSSVYAADNTDNLQNDIYASFGFKVIGSKITKYTGNTNPVYFNVGYSRNVFNNLYFDMNCSFGGAGKSETNANTNTTETKMLTYVEPSIGTIYKFKNINKEIFPLVEFGGNYVKAKLNNNVDTKINSVGNAFGIYSGIGLNIMINEFELIFGAKYEYIKISFDNVVKDNIGGFGLYAKAGYTF